MTRMIVPADLQARLLEVLDIDTEDIVLERRIRDANSALIGLDTDVEYQRLVRDAENAEDRVDDINRQRDHLESDITVARKRIDRDHEREAATNDPHELAVLEDEIASLEIRIQSLENDELDVLTERDELIAERDEIVAQRDSFHANRDARAAEINADIERAKERRDAIARTRATIVSELPTDFVELYERQRERYGVGASFLHRGITGASGVQLSPSQLDDIRRTDPDEVILCPDSNAILVRTSESGL